MNTTSGTVVHWDGKLVTARRHDGVKATQTDLDLIERWDARSQSWIECGARPALTFTAVQS